IEAIKAQVDEEIQVAADMALASPQPKPESALLWVYSPDVDPTSEQCDTEDDPHFTCEPTTMVDLLNACMKDERTRDPRIRVLRAGRGARDVRRVSEGRLRLSLADGRGRLHVRAGAAGHLSVDRARRERPAAYRHPLR